MTDQSKSRLAQQLSASLVQIVQNRPLFVWLGVWTLVLSVGAIATTGLLNPGPIEEEVAEAQFPPVKLGPPLPSIEAETAAPAEDLPFWLFGALAMGCMAGTWLIAIQLTRSNQPSQPRAAVAARQRRPRPVSRSSVPPQAPRSVPVEPLVTVMPAEESLPLDREETNLAELMDIRKRKPLSSVLRNL